MSAAIRPADPLAPALALLMARHQAAMHDDTPPESIHMLPAAALAAPGILFFAAWEGERALAMGALKKLSGPEGEIKSMHVLAECRGRGLAQAMLDHLLAAARAEGWQRLWLETGAQASFAPARALYARAGFTECPPFEGYRPDPNSTFMTLAL